MTAADLRSVLVVGFARTGRAVASELRRRGVRVVVVEDRPDDDGVAEAARLGVELLCAPGGRDLKAAAEGVELVVASPGVPPSHPAFRLGRPVLSELAFAARLAKAPVVAVTGTNGKTTVVTLIARMLEASGRKVALAGNIGRPLIEVVDSDAEVLVVEASSFQLAFAEGFRPDVGVLLNISPDHLDWHPSFEHYVASKAAVWAAQRPIDVSVANAEDPVVMDLARRAPGRLVTFGLHRGDFCVREGWLAAPGGTRIVRVRSLWRALPADQANALGALAGATSAGADLEACRLVLEGFEGLPHRVAFVGEVRGVRFYDDSKATTPASVLAALEGFRTAVLVAGGRNKGLDLGVLRQAASRLRGVVAIGEAAEEVLAAFSGATGPAGEPVALRRAGSMRDAVEEAYRLASRGDAVVLSPGCTSFDWYRSYVERGEDFAAAVRDLCERAGRAGPFPHGPCGVRVKEREC